MSSPSTTPRAGAADTVVCAGQSGSNLLRDKAHSSCMPALALGSTLCPLRWEQRLLETNRVHHKTARPYAVAIML
jgi:hypothetical protein